MGSEIQQTDLEFVNSSRKAVGKCVRSQHAVRVHAWASNNTRDNTVKMGSCTGKSQWAVTMHVCSGGLCPESK
jgi:hypothetical protein